MQFWDFPGKERNHLVILYIVKNKYIHILYMERKVMALVLEF